jgi:thiosulfate dehydrogenase
MKGFVLGIIVGVGAVALAVYIYFAAGFAPVATDAKAMPFEKKFAQMALHSRIDKDAPKNAPFQPTDANFQDGAKEYVEHCSVCHGLPDHPPTAIAAGEFPKPPHLFRGKGVTDDSPGETYWKIANGIRMTGMPGFKQTMSETEIWDVSWLLANANKLPDHVMAQLRQENIQAPPPPNPPLPQSAQPMMKH